MRASKFEVVERDYARKPLTAAEVTELVELAGGVAAVLSTRNAACKANGWTAEAPPDRDTFVAAAAADNNLVRRPILVLGGAVSVGADAIRAAVS